MLNTFWVSLRTEITKGKRTFALWLTFLFPLFTLMLITLALVNFKVTDANPWVRFIYNLNNITSFFLPFFLVLVIGYYSYIEHKSNTWKHLITQPIPKGSIFLGKLCMILILVAFSYCFILILSYLSSWLLHLIRPLKFHYTEGGVSFARLSKELLKTYLAGASIIAIQYWFSLRFRNLIIPFVLGVSLIILPVAVVIIMGMTGLINQPQSIENVFNYDPYAYPFAHIFSFLKGPSPTVVILPPLTLLYLGLAVVITFLNYLDFRKRNF